MILTLLNCPFEDEHSSAAATTLVSALSHIKTGSNRLEASTPSSQTTVVGNGDRGNTVAKQWSSSGETVVKQGMVNREAYNTKTVGGWKR